MEAIAITNHFYHREHQSLLGRRKKVKSKENSEKIEISEMTINRNLGLKSNIN